MHKGFIYSFICFAVRLFIRRPCITGLEHFIPGREAMVVANHEGAWGPVATRVYFPVPTAPWVNGAITKRGECRKFLSGFYFKEQARIPGWLALPLGMLIEPLLLHLLRVGLAVPVYFGSAKVAITCKVSLERLNAGHVLIVFPDDDSSLQTDNVPGFHDGYLVTAKIYYKITGKKLLIYPLCLSSRRNLMALGEPMEFDPGNDFKPECLRINNHVLSFIRSQHDVPNRPAQANSIASI